MHPADTGLLSDIWYQPVMLSAWVFTECTHLPPPACICCIYVDPTCCFLVESLFFIWRLKILFFIYSIAGIEWIVIWVNDENTSLCPSHSAFPCFPSSAHLHVNEGLSQTFHGKLLLRWGSQSRVTWVTSSFASQMEFPFCPSRTTACCLRTALGDAHSSKFEWRIYFGSSSIV